MGKKKQFIDKKSAASFHIIHRTTAPDARADATAASLSSLSLSSPTATAAPAAHSAYYFQPSKPDTAIPAGFPADLLLAHNEERERAAYRSERRTAAQRERDSRDPSLLPHEYDYSAHLREIGGGVFIAAAGAATYENAASKRERQQREQQQQHGDVRGEQPAVADELDSEVDWAMVRRAEKEGNSNKRRRAGEDSAVARVPADLLLALEDDEQVAADGEQHDGHFDVLDDDFVLQAMKGTGDSDIDEGDEDDEEEVKDDDDDDDDDEDDMLARIARFEMRERTEDGSEVWEGEENEQDNEVDEGEESKSTDEAAVRSQRNQLVGRRAMPSTASGEKARVEAHVDQGSGDDDEQSHDEADSFWDDDDEAQDEVHPLPSRAVDNDFDRLLSEQYGDDDIGGLDDVDESLVSGPLSIDSFADSLDAFLSRQSLPVSQGGSDLSLPSAERDAIKRRMARRLRAMAAEEGQDTPEEQWMSGVYKEVVEDVWDVESVVSTYSNTENHPTALRERSGQAAMQRAAKRKEQAQAALAAAITGALQPTQRSPQTNVESDEDGEDDEARGERNLGVARPRGESADEKRARKAAGRADKRESRQRKKQLRTLYGLLEHKQHMQHTKASVDNPVGRQLI